MKHSGGLLSVLGVGFGLAGAVGGTIGAGILRTPGLVAQQLPSTGLILAVWALGGLYALLGAICVAELASCLPRAGGWYVYAEKAFGERAGFLVGWSDWIAHCIGLAWIVTTLGDYLSALIPFSSAVIALVILALFTAIQWPGVRSGGTSQELLSLIKALAFLGLVVACFALPLPQRIESAANFIAPGTPLLVPWVIALQAVITTYDGWACPIYFAEEFSEPAKTLPRSLIGGVLAVAALYLLINGALLHVLPVPVLAESNLPAADAARLLVGANGGSVITAVALIALLGVTNTVVMAAPRILYGLGRDGLMPSFTAQVNSGGTPVPALLITVGLSALLVLGGSFDRLLGMGAFLYVSLPLSGLVALVTLRRNQADLERPFRCWLYPATPLLVGAISLAFLVAALWSDSVNSLLALALVLFGGLVSEAGRRLSPAA
ncbi:APC family permease [Vulcanococcus sp.]|uniref:APC family permease n=1 Tax=Vulcanococcus sp. TaxID=2856995 RepID=UPI003C0BACEF